MPTGIGGDHTGTGRMKHGLAYPPKRDEKDENQETPGDTRERDKNDRKKKAADKKHARWVPISEIPYGGLDNEGQQSADSRDQAHLCHGQHELVNEEGQEGTDKGSVEVSSEMDKSQRKDHLGVNTYTVIYLIHFQNGSYSGLGGVPYKNL